jgi:DNA-directed RNA polymerase specialized sigma24 family protein
MLDEDTRTAILRLHTEGHGSRKISRVLGIASDSVRRIIRCGSATVPPLLRAERAQPWRDDSPGTDRPHRSKSRSSRSSRA